MMRLYGAIQKVEPQDDGTVRVHGIAASEAVDDQGETIWADAIRAALPDYMRFPALREMHQLSAAGTTLEAEVGDDGTTRIVAHVVDPVAVAKVKNQVYRGFSIGGRVTQRDPANPKAITGLVLSEISLVDRPANPEAVFDCWKASAIPDALRGDVEPGRARPAPAGSGREPFNPPIQIWACGVAAHHHRGKSDAVKCLETQSLGATASLGPPALEEIPEFPPGERRDAVGADAAITEVEGGDAPAGSPREHDEANYADPGYQSDDGDGPPSAEEDEEASRAVLTRAPWDAGRAVRTIQELDWLRDALGVETAMADGHSMQPGRLQANIAELCGVLNTLVTEESGEILSDAQIDCRGLPQGPAELLATAASTGAVRIANLVRTGKPNMHKLATGPLAKAKHSQGDQALVDMALYACDKCVKIDGLSVGEREHMDSAGHHLREAGAAPMPEASEDMAGDVVHAAPQVHLPASEFRSGGKTFGLIAKAGGSRNRAHRNLMDIAHRCVGKLTDGTACSRPSSRSDASIAHEQSAETGEVAKTGARHSGKTMEHLRAAHDHLISAGAQCECGAEDAGEERNQSLPQARVGGSALEPKKALPVADLAKVLADERAEKAALVRALGEMLPMLDRLSKRVDDIASTPLPPLTIARGSVSVSKQQDGGGTSDIQLSPEAIASALAKMSKEDQTLTLIKASYANPIRVLGSATAEP
jgi:hypothetical protein